MGSFGLSEIASYIQVCFFEKSEISDSVMKFSLVNGFKENECCIIRICMPEITLQ